MLLHHVSTHHHNDTPANTNVTSSLQDNRDSDSEEDDSGYTPATWKVEPLFVSPIVRPHEIVALSSYEETGSYPNDDNHRGVNTPNNLCDDSDVNSIDNDSVYCRVLVVQHFHTDALNIVDSDANSDDDNIGGDSQRVSPVQLPECHPVDTPTRDISDIDDNGSDGYAKAVMSTTPGDSPGRDITDTDGSDSDTDDACGYSRAVTAVTNRGDADGSCSDTDYISGYSKAATSTTHDAITDRCISDSASPGSDDEDDMTGYSKVVTSNKHWITWICWHRWWFVSWQQWISMPAFTTDKRNSFLYMYNPVHILHQPLERHG